MAKHMRYECKHGKVIRQCRCPSPDKSVRVVDCPDDCESDNVPNREDN